MMVELVEKIKPQDIDTSKHFYATLNNWEQENIIRNIVIIMEKGNNWLPFTWEEYCAMCTHTTSSGEKDILDQFVDSELLVMTDGKYHITNKFVATIMDFLKQE